MATTLKTRLRRLMREMRWDQADLAAAAKASRQAVSRWLSDGHEMKAKYGFAIQDASGFCARWILLGEGPERMDEAEDFPELRAELLRHTRRVVEILRQARGEITPR